MKLKRAKSESVKVTHAMPASPHSKALYDAGKSILVDSIETGREFCKFMVGSSTGAVPVYLGILTIILPENYELGMAAGWTIAIPAIGYLVSSIMFTLGFLPLSTDISLDSVEEIEDERIRIITHRQRFIWIGMGIFMLSSLWALWAIIRNIGLR